MAGAGAAASNATAINAAIAACGTARIPPGLGQIQVAGSIVLSNGGNLDIGSGTQLYRADGSGVPIVKNKFAGYLIAGNQIARSGSTVAVVTDKGHTVNTGDTAYIANATVAAYNVRAAALTRIDADHWSYVTSGSATDNAGSNSNWVYYIPIARNLAPGSFTVSTALDWLPALQSVVGNGTTATLVFRRPHRIVSGQSVTMTGFSGGDTALNSTFVATATTPYAVTVPTTYNATATSLGLAQVLCGYVTVNDPGHDLRTGMRVYLIPSLVGDQNLGTTALSNQWDLLPVTRTTAATWTYKAPLATTAPTGTVGLNYTRGISITGGGELEGNIANQAAVANQGARLGIVYMTAVSGLRIDATVSGALWHTIFLLNCTDFEFNVKSRDALVSIQMEGSATRVRGTRLLSEAQSTNSPAPNTDDVFALTGTKYMGNGTYDNTTSPYGLGWFDDVVLDDLEAVNALNGWKITGDQWVNYRGIRGGPVNGRLLDSAPPNNTPVAGVRIMDDSAALTSCTIESLDIGPVLWQSAVPGATTYGVILGNSGNNGRIKVEIAWAPSYAMAFYGGPGNALNGYTKDLTVVGDDWPLSRTYLAAITQGDGSSGGHNVGTFRIRRCNPKLTTGATAPVVLQQNNSVAIGTLDLGDISPSTELSNSGILADLRNTSRVMLNNITSEDALGLSSVLRFNKAGQGTDIFLNGVVLASNSFVNDNGVALGQINVYCNNVKWTASGGANFLQCAGATPVALFGGANNSFSPSNAMLVNASPSYRINCPSFPINLTTLAAQLKAAALGDQILSTTATGTLPANSVAVSKSTGVVANQWCATHNLSLTN